MLYCTEETVGTYAAPWFFGEKSVRKWTVRRKGKNRRDATELATGEKRRGHGFLTTQGAGTG